MRSVHIRIGHDDDLVIAQFGDIKIIAVAFGKSAAKGIDHGLDLRIGQNLVNAGLFHVQNLSADRQDCLITSGFWPSWQNRRRNLPPR